MVTEEKKNSKTTPPPEGHVRVTINIPIQLKEKLKIAQIIHPGLPQNISSVILAAIENYLDPYTGQIERILKERNERIQEEKTEDR